MAITSVHIIDIDRQAHVGLASLKHRCLLKIDHYSLARGIISSSAKLLPEQKEQCYFEGYIIYFERLILPQIRSNAYRMANLVDFYSDLFSFNTFRIPTEGLLSGYILS